MCSLLKVVVCGACNWPLFAVTVKIVKGCRRRLYTFLKLRGRSHSTTSISHHKRVSIPSHLPRNLIFDYLSNLPSTTWLKKKWACDISPALSMVVRSYTRISPQNAVIVRFIQRLNTRQSCPCTILDSSPFPTTRGHAKAKKRGPREHKFRVPSRHHFL